MSHAVAPLSIPIVSLTSADSPHDIRYTTPATLYSCNTSGGPIIITFPLAAASTGREYYFFLGTAGNDLTLSRAGSDTIDRSTTVVLDAGNELLGVQSDNISNWVIQNASHAGHLKIKDAATIITASNVEDALQENRAQINLNTIAAGLPQDFPMTDKGTGVATALLTTDLSQGFLCSPTAADVTFTLPLAATIIGRYYYFNNWTGAFDITVTPAGADSIEGVAGVYTILPDQEVKIMAIDGTSWEIVTSNLASEIKLVDVAGYFTATDAEAALAELITDPLKRLPLATGDTPYAVVDEKSLIIEADTSGGVLEIDLPEIGGSVDVEDKLLIIHQIAGGNTLTIDPHGTQTINGGGAGAALTIDHAGAVLFLHADSNDNWAVMTSNAATYMKVLDTAGYLTATNVETALAELASAADGIAAVSATPQTLTVADTERVFSYDDTALIIVANIPEASTVIGRKYFFIKTAGGNQVDLTPDAADSIDGAGVGVAYSLTQNGEWVMMMALDAVNWKILATNVAGKIVIKDAGSIIAATEVEGALQENRTAINLNTDDRHVQGTDQGLDTGGANAVVVADVKDAVGKKHAQNTDQGLDTGGANEVTAANAKDAVDKKHVAGTDQGLDTGGANAVVVADVKDAVDKKHAQNTDSGTTSQTYGINSSSNLGKWLMSVVEGAGDFTLTVANVALTGNRVITIKDETGTVALITDIAADANLSPAAQAVVTAGACDIDTNLSAKAQRVVADDSDHVFNVPLRNVREETANGTLTDDTEAGQFSVSRTKGATLDKYNWQWYPPQRSTASYGLKFDSITISYEQADDVMDGGATDLGIIVYRTPQPADTAAAAAVTTGVVLASTGDNLTNSIAGTGFHTVTIALSVAYSIDNKDSFGIELIMDDTGDGTNAAIEITGIWMNCSDIK